MLYNPKWEAPTKPDVFSLESLIAWLEKQPATRTYKWHCCNGGCLIGLYAADIGIDMHACHDAFYRRRQLSLAATEPHTFGAALARARAIRDR